MALKPTIKSGPLEERITCSLNLIYLPRKKRQIVHYRWERGEVYIEVATPGGVAYWVLCGQIARGGGVTEIIDFRV